jgi:hypothetical protein
MLVTGFFILLAFACFRGLTSDHGALSFVILIGFFQDPIRKIISGEPVLMTVMVGVVLACMSLRLALDSKNSIFEPFYGWSAHIAAPLNVYLCVLFLQGVHSFVRYGSLVLTGLGAIFYLAPLVAIVVGYFQFRQFKVVKGFLYIFSALAFTVCLSVLASYLGVQSDLFGEVGAGLIIYDQGTILKAYSGLMRSSEIASWHMGACVCFIIILVVDKGVSLQLFIALAAVVFLLSAIVLTGRRKMLLQIVIFAAMYFPVLRYYQRRLSSRFISIAAIALLLLLSAYWFIPSFEGTEYDLYLARGASVFGDAGERFTTLGLGSIGWAYEAHGFLGGGLGVAAQGSQHFVEGNVGGAGEGGIGKLVSELGLISLVILAWLTLAFAKHLHRCLQMVASLAPEKLLFTVGVLVFLASNVPTFIVASQVFGDVFILLVLGLLAGSLFSLPRQVSSQIELNQPPELKGI